jgi:hypothetical protein
MKRYVQWSDHSSTEFYRLYEKYYGIEEEVRAQQKAVDPLKNE